MDASPNGVSHSAVSRLRILVVSNHWNETKNTPYAGIFVDRQIASLQEAGVEIGIFDIGTSHAPLHLFRKWRELRREVRRFNPHLVHARYGTIVAALSVLSGCPAVITFCGSDLLPGASVSLARTYSGIFLSNVAALLARANICVSAELRQALWWRRDRAVVIPDGIDLDLFSPGSREAARRALGWDLHRPMVLINARRDPKNKGLDLAHAAIRVVKSYVPDVELKVVESVAPTQMPLYYRAADVLLCASQQEGSPNVVKEALACNLPVVSSPVGDVPERLAKVQPSNVVRRDPQFMGKALAEILRRRTRCNGREHVSHLSLAKTVQKVLRVYHTALNSNHRVLDSNRVTPVATGVSVVPMTVRMVSDVTKIHQEAFAGYMSTCMGGAYVRAYMRWFCQAEQAIALVATDSDNEILGYVVGAPLGYNTSMNRQLFLIAAAGILLRPWLLLSAAFRRALLARLRLMFGLFSSQQVEFTLPEPAMSLVTIGVSSAARGKNVGFRLVQAFEAKAREQKMRSLRLSVLPDNGGARRLYEKCAWQAVAPQGGVRENEAMYYFRVLDDKAEAKPFAKIPHK